MSLSLLTTTTRRATALSSHLIQPLPSKLLSSSSSPSRTMASLPTTMKGVTIAKTGDTSVLDYSTTLPVPSPAENHLLVKNDFVGVNFIDTYFRSGLYPPPSFPYTLGREGSGTIVSLGPGALHQGLQAGDRVVYLSEAAYAEFTPVPASKAHKLPPTLSTRIAAASFLQGLTALTLIREAHAVQKGDWVLVHAAAGGTGLWLCQLLKAIGAHTIGTASTAEKISLAKKAGAEYMIDYTHSDVKAEIMHLTSNAGVIAVFDGVGKDTFDLSLDVLARKGSLVSFGNASGAVPPVTISRLSAKNARLMRPTLFGYVATREEFERYSGELLAFVEEGKVDVRVHEVYPLSEVRRAHEDLEGRRTMGKVLLDPSK